MDVSDIAQDYVSHYFPVDEHFTRGGLYMTGGGRETVRPGVEYPLTHHPPLYYYKPNQGRVLPEFTIDLFSGGKGWINTKKTGKIDIQGASLLYMPSGVWHNIMIDESSSWNNRWFCLGGDLVHIILSRNLPNPFLLHLDEQQHLQCQKDMDLLINQIHAHATTNSQSLTLKVLGLLFGLLEAAGQQHLLPWETAPIIARSENIADIPDPLVAQAVELIWSYNHQYLTVADVVSRLGTNRRTLERRFLKIRAHGILDEIVQCRLSRAKRLLKETTLSAKRIAHLSGFSDSQQMRMTFLRYEKLTPKQWKER